MKNVENTDVRISIIVPVYNAEKYIRRCIDSILNQTYKNWELFLIDDGSVDTSGKICDEYTLNDLRIKTIHQKNAGVSAARNIGLEKASGEYVCFIDSDDVIVVDYLATLINICNEEVDLLWFGFHEISSNNKILTRKALIGEFDLQNKNVKMEFVLNNFLDGLLYFAPWNKLYRRKIIVENHILFPTQVSMGEDLFFNMQYLLVAKKIKGIDTELYNYYIRTDSAMGSQSQYMYLDQFVRAMKIIEINKDNFELNKRDINRLFYKAIFNQYARMKSLSDLKENIKRAEEKKYLRRNAIYFALRPIEIRNLFHKTKNIYSWNFLLHQWINQIFIIGVCLHD